MNKANLVSFQDPDHIDRRAGATKDKVPRFLKRAGLDLSGGKVYLLTSCRVFGYVFNPISVYYCHARSGRLEAVVAEVRNTFGEQHLYLLTEPLNLDNGLSARRYRARKVMHVSPFISMDATYEFHPIRLIRDRTELDHVRLVTGKTGIDLTKKMRRYARSRVRVLARENLSGYILKKDSPSCGMERVKVWHDQGANERNGRGLFAAELPPAVPNHASRGGGPPARPAAP